MTSQRVSVSWPGHLPDEDEFVLHVVGNEHEAWEIMLAQARDVVTKAEAGRLSSLGVDDPLTPPTRRRWLDALLVARLLRAAPLDANDTLSWAPFLVDITAAYDHFVREHLSINGNTEVGEAVLACVAAVPRLHLRLRDYRLAESRPTAEAARRIIFDAYIEYLQAAFPTTAPIIDLQEMAKKFPDVPASAWRAPRDMP